MQASVDDISELLAGLLAAQGLQEREEKYKKEAAEVAAMNADLQNRIAEDEREGW